VAGPSLEVIEIATVSSLFEAIRFTLIAESLPFTGQTDLTDLFLKFIAF
jgi:hypothetical protein